MPLIKVRSHLQDYEVHFGAAEGYLQRLGPGEKCFVVDENVKRCHARLLSQLPEADQFTFAAEEESKTLEGVQRIYDYLLSRSAKRNLTLITIGGGILQDVTGFAASTLYRGIRWLFVPTTLLAQADSCIGSKTSLNYRSYKNLVGTFYPPAEIWVDPAFLSTLQPEDFYSGLGEVVKLHIMAGDEKIGQYLEALPRIMAGDMPALLNIVQSSLEIKTGYIQDDEFDRGRRNLLNYGHSVGHAIEAVSRFRVPHGQAVVAGMIVANYVAEQRGLVSRERRQYLESRLLLPSLKTRPTPDELEPPAIIEAMGKDKKRTGSDLALIMPAGADFIRADDVSPAEISAALKNAECSVPIRDAR